MLGLFAVRTLVAKTCSPPPPSRSLSSHSTSQWLLAFSRTSAWTVVVKVAANGGEHEAEPLADPAAALPELIAAEVQRLARDPSSLSPTLGAIKDGAAEVAALIQQLGGEAVEEAERVDGAAEGAEGVHARLSRALHGELRGAKELLEELVGLALSNAPLLPTPPAAVPPGATIDLDGEVGSVLRAAMDIASAENDAYTADRALRAECMRVRFEARAREG